MSKQSYNKYKVRCISCNHKQEIPVRYVTLKPTGSLVKLGERINIYETPKSQQCTKCGVYFKVSVEAQIDRETALVTKRDMSKVDSQSHKVEKELKKEVPQRGSRVRKPPLSKLDDTGSSPVPATTDSESSVNGNTTGLQPEDVGSTPASRTIPPVPQVGSEIKPTGVEVETKKYKPKPIEKKISEVIVPSKLVKYFRSRYPDMYNQRVEVIELESGVELYAYGFHNGKRYTSGVTLDEKDLNKGEKELNKYIEKLMKPFSKCKTR